MFAICIESSHKRGLGHLFRSLILANNLRNKGFKVKFIVNDNKFSCEKIRNEGFEFKVQDIHKENNWEEEFLGFHNDIKIWINDRLDTRYHHAKLIKKFGLGLVTFDDRGSGSKFSDLNVAALTFENTENCNGVKVLKGHKYLIIDPIIDNFKKIRATQKSLIVTIGGSDTWGITPYIMENLLDLKKEAKIILGPAFEHFNEVKKIQYAAPEGFFNIKHNVPSLLKEMNSSQIAITSGGTTPFQANAMGLPCIVVATESFEIEVGKYLEKLGCNIYGGYKKDLNIDSLKIKFPVEEYSRKALQKVDSKGIERVIKHILEIIF